MLKLLNWFGESNKDGMEKLTHEGDSSCHLHLAQRCNLQYKITGRNCYTPCNGHLALIFRCHNRCVRREKFKIFPSHGMLHWAMFLDYHLCRNFVARQVV